MATAKMIFRKGAFKNGIQQTECGLTLNDVASILSRLPDNTYIRNITLLPITTLSLEFEVSLFNEMFKEGAVIEDKSSYARDIGFTEDGKVIQYNRNLNDLNLEEVVRKHTDVKES